MLLASSAELIPGAWLAAAREPHVEVLLSPGDAIDEVRLRGAVAAVLVRARERVVAAVLRRCGALFAGREDAVRAVVVDSWGIPRPWDWVRAFDCTLA